MSVNRLRQLMQYGFGAYILFLGWRFAHFVAYYRQNLEGPAPSRPTGVDGFLPVGALASLKQWLLSGNWDQLHPAALVIFLTILVTALVAKKSFCSWLCPVGTVSDLLHSLHCQLRLPNLRPWRWLDILLRSGKYLLLAFFLKIILLDMPLFAVRQFLQSPYWAISDVKMLDFFVQPSGTTLMVTATLLLLTLFIPHFWCRYLCPYGGLLGLVSLLSLTRVRRESSHCNGCGACTRACPNRIEVANKEAVCSLECSACLRCVAACQQKAIALTGPLQQRQRPAWLLPTLLLGIYAVGIGLGIASGHWQSSLGPDAYRQLLPMAAQVHH